MGNLKSKVSVIIPSYNKSNYITKTLDSLINQDFNAWEAIVVDDGSTDNSIQIIQRYTKKDKRIFFYSREILPKGASTCRNIGIKKSQSEYIIFLDADDLLTTNTLKQRVNLVDKNPEMDFLVFPLGHFYKHIGDCSKIQIANEKDNHFLQFLSYNYQWHTSSLIWHKSFLFYLGLFDEEYPRLQDIELHTRALMVDTVKYKIMSNVDVDCYYRIDPLRHAGNIFRRMKVATKGFELFLNKMYPMVKQKYNRAIYLGALKEVIFEALSNIIHQELTIKNKYTFIMKLTQTDVYHKEMSYKDKVRFYYKFLDNILYTYKVKVFKNG
jgi:glycosyltransferase involved in cell wall biosynthesis